MIETKTHALKNTPYFQSVVEILRRKLGTLFTEKILHEFFAFAFANAFNNLRLVIESTIFSKIIQGARRTPFGIARAEYNLRNPCMHKGSHAHGTGFDRNIERCF